MTTRDKYAAHALQHNHLTAENARLRAEVLAQRARHGGDAPQILIDIARCLQEADELADPMTTTSPTTDTIRRPRPGSKAPKGALAPIRRAANHLHSQLQGLVNGWDAAVRRLDDPDEPHHEPAAPEKRPQTVRCRTTDCDRQGRRVPWLELAVDDTGQTIPRIVWDCRGCGNPYPSHPARRMEP